MPSPPHSVPTTPRRRRVPPALTRGVETLPASAVLDEVPGPLGVVLWRSARNVSLWSATPSAGRAQLFDARAAELREAEIAALGAEAELLAPLSVVVRLIESPERMDAPRVVNACRRIALWAEQRGALGTALEFAQAAALTAPRVAALAYAVGRLARRRAEYDRAETWYARAIVQARRTSDWRTYALSYSGLGNLNVQKGNFPAAARAHGRCRRAAERHRLCEIEGIALHDLFVLAYETGDRDDPSELGRAALEAYGRGSPQVLRLAYDIAYYWTLRGRFAHALRAARAILPFMAGPEERVVVLAAIARAAGGIGAREEHASAARSTWKLVRSGCAEDAAPRALLGLAHGAASLGEWDSAESALREAAARAAVRGEHKIRMTAEAMLESVASRSRTQAHLVEQAADLDDGLMRALEDALQEVPAGVG